MPERTPLAYSLPAHRPGGYAQHGIWLDNLQDLGFRWVTLHPTFLVTKDLRIHPERSPSIGEIEKVVEAAGERGLSVQMEPHLDWESTLTGGAYEWRNSMLIDPLGEYRNLVLEPLGAMNSRYVTLGSELDLSVSEFPDRWARLPVRSGAGHKLNHDFRKMSSAGRYLERLDYVAFSFYPSTPAFTEHARRLRRSLPAGPEFAIGEFGLGSPDTSRPWHFDAESFRSEEDFRARRVYYLSFLEALRGAPDVFGRHPATFWSSGHFDFLGALEWPGHERFRDDILRESVRDYLREDL